MKSIRYKTGNYAIEVDSVFHINMLERMYGLTDEWDYLKEQPNTFLPCLIFVKIEKDGFIHGAGWDTLGSKGKYEDRGWIIVQPISKTLSKFGWKI